MAEETKKTVHPRMAEALANAQKAAVSNRGMYPHTKATNVFNNEGGTVEARPEAVSVLKADSPDNKAAAVASVKTGSNSTTSTGSTAGTNNASNGKDTSSKT